MRRTTLLSMASAVSLAACGGGTRSAPSPNDAVLLRLSPPVGQISGYTTTERTTFEVPGLPVFEGPMTSTQVRYTTLKVLGADRRYRTVEKTTDSLVVDKSSDAGAFGATLRKAAETVRGARDTFIIDDRSRVVGGDSPAGSEAGTALDPSSVFESFDHPLELPEAPVKPGDRWTVPIDNREPVENMGTMVAHMEATYVLERVEMVDGARHAVLSINAAFTMTFEQSETAPAAMDMDFNGTETGEVTLDLDAGRVVHRASTAHSNGSFSTMGMDLKMVMDMQEEYALIP